MVFNGHGLGIKFKITITQPDGFTSFSKKIYCVANHWLDGIGKRTGTYSIRL